MALPQVLEPYDGALYFGARPAKEKSKLDMETFIRLLSVQLSHQNPLEPMNDRDFFAQMAQLGQVQGLDKVQGSLEMSQAAGMIGKKVTAVRTLTDNGENSLVTGVVEKVTMRDGDRILTIRDSANGVLVDVRIGNVREISA